MINKKLYCYNSLFYLIILWVLCFSIRRAYLAPIFDHEAHCYVYSGYFYEANGWLFILLVQCLKRWFGASLFIVRFLPILANLGICCLLYKIAEYIYNKKIALLSLFLYAISPMAYYYASYCRFYAFGVFFILLACYLTLKAYETGSPYLWSAAAFAYLCAFSSWILTLAVMIGIWSFMIFFMKLDFRDRKRLLQIAILVSLNFTILIIFDAYGGKRISNGLEFSVYQFMFDVLGMSGMSSFSDTLARHLEFHLRLSRDIFYLGMFFLFLIYFIYCFACTFKMSRDKIKNCASAGTNKADRSKYSFLPSFVFFVSVCIFVLFSFFQTSVFNCKNLFLLLPMWIMMFSAFAVRFRIIVFLFIALFCGMADYICYEGFAPEHQMKMFSDNSYEMYVSNDNVLSIMNSRNIKIGDNVHYDPDATESLSLSILRSALNSQKVCLLLTDLRKEKMLHFINQNNPGLRSYTYGETQNADIKAYLIVPQAKLQ